MSHSSLNRIGNHVYWLPSDSATDRPVLGVIVGTRDTLLVDAGNSPAHVQLLRDALAEANLAQPTLLALTHWHWDHVFGMGALDLPTFASHETRRIVSQMAQLDWSDAALDERVADGSEIAFCRDMIKLELLDRSDLVIRPPNITFTDAVDIDLGGVSVHIAHIGGDHAPDSCIVYIPEDKVIFLSDCLYPAIYAPQRYYTTTRLFPLIDQLLSYDADFYLTGHDEAPLPREEILGWTNSLKIAGEIVERLGNDREAMVAEIQRTAGLLPDEDPGEFADWFLVGKR